MSLFSDSWIVLDMFLKISTSIFPTCRKVEPWVKCSESSVVATTTHFNLIIHWKTHLFVQVFDAYWLLWMRSICVSMIFYVFLCVSFYTIYIDINNYLKKSPLYLTLYTTLFITWNAYIYLFVYICFCVFFANWALCAFFVYVYSCLCMFVYVFLYVCLWNYSKTYRPV